MIDSSEENRRSLIPALFAMADRDAGSMAPAMRRSAAGADIPARPLLAADDGPAIISLAKPGGLRVFLGAKPAVRLRYGGITPARLNVIDTDVTCQARALGQFCLDAAGGWHRGFIRKQGFTQLAVLVASAGRAQQGSGLFPMAEVLRSDKAAPPKTAKLVLRVCLVLLEPTLGLRFNIQRKTLTHQQLVQAGCFAVGGAKADVPFRVDFGWPQILAADGALANQLRQAVARFHATRPGLGMFVDAHLVIFRSIDAIEFVGNAGKLDGVSVLDDRVLSPTRSYREQRQQNNNNTHRPYPQTAEMIISRHVSHNRDTRTSWKGGI